MTTIAWYWREVGYDCATMMACCLISVPFLVAIDVLEDRRDS